MTRPGSWTRCHDSGTISLSANLWAGARAPSWNRAMGRRRWSRPSRTFCVRCRCAPGKTFEDSMCGITGIYHYGSDRPVDPSRLVAMTDLLAHRGPDDSGVYVAGNLG